MLNERRYSDWPGVAPLVELGEYMTNLNSVYRPDASDHMHHVLFHSTGSLFINEASSKSTLKPDLYTNTAMLHDAVGDVARASQTSDDRFSSLAPLGSVSNRYLHLKFSL
jgi:hypothetical protein